MKINNLVLNRNRNGKWRDCDAVLYIFNITERTGIWRSLGVRKRRMIKISIFSFFNYYLYYLFELKVKVIIFRSTSQPSRTNRLHSSSTASTIINTSLIMIRAYNKPAPHRSPHHHNITPSSPSIMIMNSRKDFIL